MELDLHSYGDLDWLIAELRMPPEATRASARRLVELACLDAVGPVEIESITPPPAAATSRRCGTATSCRSMYPEFNDSGTTH